MTMIKTDANAPWRNDPEFEEYMIEEVRPHRLDEHGGNFTVKFNGVWVFRFDSPHLIPQDGQMIRLFGRFNTVRGIVIDGQLIYYYPTVDAMHEALKRV